MLLSMCSIELFSSLLHPKNQASAPMSVARVTVLALGPLEIRACNIATVQFSEVTFPLKSPFLPIFSLQCGWSDWRPPTFIPNRTPRGWEAL